MCGRYSLTTPLEAVTRIFAVTGRGLTNLAPRYNIAPTQNILVVRPAAGGDGGRELAFLRWGLAPGWSKTLPDKPLINARGETVDEKPSFRAGLKRRRCLVPADGYFEWSGERGAKQPYYIAPGNGEPFAFAGLWESWAGPDGAVIESCAFITTAAQGPLKDIHHRMPVVLAAADYESWLDVDGVTPGQAKALLTPGPGEFFAFHRVSRRVNSVRFDDPACIVPEPGPEPEKDPKDDLGPDQPSFL